MIPGSLRLLVAGALAVTLFAPSRAGAADASWKTHQDQKCGFELKYPASYSLEASGARDFCAPWISIGVRDARRLHVLFRLEVRESERGDRALASAQDFALRVATDGCTADGPDSSTYCTNGEVRSTFRTAQGFRGFEIHLTEVHEAVSPHTIVTGPRGPILALDLSDDEVVRVLMADAEPGRGGELRAILDTFRVWTKARRPTPRVVEMDPFRLNPGAFVLRVAAGEQYRTNRWPPSPVTTWLLIDPRGRRLGRDSATGTWYSEVPAVTHSTAAESGFMLREPVEGRYELQIIASAPSVPYRVVGRAPDRAGMPATAHHEGRTAEPGAIDRYEVLYAPGSTPAITIAEVPDFSRFTVLLSSRASAELFLTDPLGRHTGLDPARKVEERRIPGSSYLDEGAGRRSMVLEVRQPTEGAYALQVTGTAPGSYSLDLRAWDRRGTASARPELRDVPTESGAVHVYRLDYASTARTPLTLDGGFDGDRLLAYANPTSADTRLRAGSVSFPLIIFYGARIKPVTFNALLNGDNITGRFTPEPESFQVVRIPLGPGLNTLVLSIEGTTASGPNATDTRRLVFRVE